MSQKCFPSVRAQRAFSLGSSRSGMSQSDTVAGREIKAVKIGSPSLLSINLRFFQYSGFRSPPSGEHARCTFPLTSTADIAPWLFAGSASVHRLTPNHIRGIILDSSLCSDTKWLETESLCMTRYRFCKSADNWQNRISRFRDPERD